MNVMSGLRPEERFSNLEQIGRGSFGAVYRCTDVVSRDTVAVKIIDLEQAEDEIDDIQQVCPLVSSAALPCGRGCTGVHCPGGRGLPRGAAWALQCRRSGQRATSGVRSWLLWQEIAVMSQCDSPYVTRYFGSYVSGTKLWIVMEYVGGGSVLVRSTLALSRSRSSAGRWVLPSQQPRSTHHLAWLGRANPDPNPPAWPSHVPRRR